MAFSDFSTVIVWLAKSDIPYSEEMDESKEQFSDCASKFVSRSFLVQNPSQFVKKGVSDLRITFSGFYTANQQNQNSINITNYRFID